MLILVLLLNGIINKGKKTAIRNISGMKTQQLFQSKQQQATTSSLFNKPYCVKGNYCNSTFNTVIIVFNKDGEQKVARWSVRTCTIVFLAWMKNFFYFFMTSAISNIAFSIWSANRFEDVVEHVVFDETYKIVLKIFLIEIIKNCDEELTWNMMRSSWQTIYETP